MKERRDIHEEARGRWRSILASLGVAEEFLRNRHGPCPVCGGTDRYRFDDKEGRGSFFCSSCGPGYSGIDLLMRIRGISAKEAIKLVREVLPGSSVDTSQQRQRRGSEETIKKITELWKESSAVDAGDPVGRYLKGRGLVLPTGHDSIRTHPALEYHDDDLKSLGRFPAMLAPIRNGRGKPMALHRTYVKGGKKAPVPKPKKVIGYFDESCAIRLYDLDDDEELGVAEGIETGIAAYMQFGVPVWALISASHMERFLWPKTTKHLVIFGDHDASFTGQKAAYTLAFRAKSKGVRVTVKLPDRIGDWDDMLKNG